MNNAEEIIKYFIGFSGVLMYFATSYKVGYFILFDPKSLTAIYEFKKEKISLFFVSLVVVFILSYLPITYFIGFTESALQYTLVITAFASFTLLHWIVVETPVRKFKKAKKSDDDWTNPLL